MKWMRISATVIAVLWLSLLLPTTKTEASTKKDDWTWSTTLTASNYDSSTTLAFNYGRCKKLLENPDQEVTFQLSLPAAAKPAPNAKVTVKYAIGNESCSSTNPQEIPADACQTVLKEMDLVSGMPPLTFKRKMSQLGAPNTADECADISMTSTIHIIVREPATALKPAVEYTQDFYLSFDTVRPQPPTEVKATGGSSSFKVSWTSHSSAEKYAIYYIASPGTLTAGTEPELVTGVSRKTTSDTKADVKDSVEPDVEYAVAIASVDSRGNESVLSEVVTVKTIKAQDFWESYRAQNADVDGGFCFIATAAWGSTQEPHVWVLRQFRDRILAQSAIGRALIDAYYANSPPLAHFIGQHDSARTVTRVLLWPLYAFAIVTLYAQPAQLALMALAAMLAFFLVFFRRRQRRVSTRHAAAFLVASAMAITLVALPGEAAADSDVDMVVEIKAGPYTPDKLGDAFDAHFGKESGFIVEGEFDWQLYRGIGSAAIAANVGYGYIEGDSITSSGTKSLDKTSLSWLPLRLSAVYRFDYFWTRWGVPLTIYGKAGLDYSFWWIKNGSDDVAKSNGKDGYGGTFGWHAVGGVAFVLDFLAPDMAQSFDVGWGVNNSYIFAEFLYADISQFGKKDGFDVGDRATFQIGLALEF